MLAADATDLSRFEGAKCRPKFDKDERIFGDLAG